MRRATLLFALSLFLIRLPAVAQDDSTAAAIAAREAADERYKRLASDLQAVQSDNEALHAKIASLEQEIQSLHEAQAHAGDNSGIQDQFKHLADAIQEVDKKRVEDKDAISEDIRKSIERLEKLMGSGSGAGIEVASPATHESRTKPSSTDETPSAPVNGYSYTIKDGDTLGAVVKAYNDDYKSKGLKPITIHQAKEANPKVDWTRLRVGQKIIIPRPEGG